MLFDDKHNADVVYLFIQEHQNNSCMLRCSILRAVPSDATL
jgi:hypothetical protein